MPRRRIPEGMKPDSVTVSELLIYIDNNAQLYRSQHIPIKKNLSRKMKKGNYDHALAIKGFMYLVDAGAKAYQKEFGGAGEPPWNVNFPKNVRMAVAEALADRFEEEFKNKEYDFMERKHRKAESLISQRLGESEHLGMQTPRSMNLGRSLGQEMGLYDDPIEEERVDEAIPNTWRDVVEAIETRMREKVAELENLEGRKAKAMVEAIDKLDLAKSYVLANW